MGNPTASDQRREPNTRLPYDTYNDLKVRTHQLVDLVSGIVEEPITIETLRKVEHLFEAKEDILEEPEHAELCDRQVDLESFRTDTTTDSLEKFIMRFNGNTGEIFRIIFDSQPDKEMRRLHKMIHGQFFTGFLVDKAERVIALTYMREIFTDCILDNPNLFAFEGNETIEDEADRLGYYLSNILLMSLQQQRKMSQKNTQKTEETG